MRVMMLLMLDDVFIVIVIVIIGIGKRQLVIDNCIMKFSLLTWI